VRPLASQAVFAQFWFMLPEYRFGESALARLPTPRATLYFAADVRERASGRVLGSSVFCEGPHSKHFEVRYECAEMVAVKVRSGSLAALLGAPARDLRDRTVDLVELWGRRASELAEQIQEAPTLEQRLRTFQVGLARRYRPNERQDALAHEVASTIERRAGKVRVAELGERVGIGRRAMLQQFDACVGLTPKQYARVIRLRATITRLATAAGTDWARLSNELGYYDQSHMIHEFRDLLGIPPAIFRKQLGTFRPLGSPAFGRRALPKREQNLYRLLGMVSEWAEAERTPRRSAIPAA
jgi:AraC-like DNA-binding protein